MHVEELVKLFLVHYIPGIDRGRIYRKTRRKKKYAGQKKDFFSVYAVHVVLFTIGISATALHTSLATSPAGRDPSRASTLTPLFSQTGSSFR
jgi:hypothetical protein